MTAIATDFRHQVHDYLQTLVERFYRDVPYAAKFLNEEKVCIEYYKRYTIEIILRLRLKRSIDALTIHYFTKCDPKRAKQWAAYTEDEMLHDALFVRDLEALGVTREEIYQTVPLLSTKLLQGYFYYGLEHGGRPLASLCSSYFIEYTTQKTQPKWLDTIAKAYGDDCVKGARAHVSHDSDESHVDFVWDVLSSFIKSKEDEEQVLKHFDHVYTLFALFFTELRNATKPEQACTVSTFERLVA